MDERKEMKKELDQTMGVGFRIGSEYVSPPVRVGGQYFSFKADQQRFLYALIQTHGDLEKSCERAGWLREHMERFFSSRKWRHYKEKVLAMGAIRNGDLRDEWWEFMSDGMNGYRQWYEGACTLCHQDYRMRPQQAEQYRNDDMALEMTCWLCKTPVKLEFKEEDFKPSREQVQCAAEIGARIEPKREHISHSFTEETFSFVLDGTAQ